MTDGIQPISSGGNDPVAAAQQLEAYFLRQILSEVGPGGAFGGKGIAGSTFRGMFEEALADAISETGQVGLAQDIMGTLEGTGAQRATVDMAANAEWAGLEAELGSEGSDPQSVADLALAERLRGPAADPEHLNSGRNGPNPTSGGE